MDQCSFGDPSSVSEAERWRAALTGLMGAATKLPAAIDAVRREKKENPTSAGADGGAKDALRAACAAIREAAAKMPTGSGGGSYSTQVSSTNSRRRDDHRLTTPLSLDPCTPSPILSPTLVRACGPPPPSAPCFPSPHLQHPH